MELKCPVCGSKNVTSMGKSPRAGKSPAQKIFCKDEQRYRTIKTEEQK